MHRSPSQFAVSWRGATIPRRVIVLAGALVSWGCGPIDEAVYCENRPFEQQCPAPVHIEGAYADSPICIDGNHAELVDVLGPAVEGEEERVFDEELDGYILEVPCCYDVRVRASGEPCSA